MGNKESGKYMKNIYKKFSIIYLYAKSQMLLKIQNVLGNFF